MKESGQRLFTLQYVTPVYYFYDVMIYNKPYLTSYYKTSALIVSGSRLDNIGNTSDLGMGSLSMSYLLDGRKVWVKFRFGFAW